MSFACSPVRSLLVVGLVLVAGAVQAQTVALNDPSFNVTTVGYPDPWNVGGGTPTVESGHMHLDAGDSAYQWFEVPQNGPYTISFDVSGSGRSRLFLTSDVTAGTFDNPVATSGDSLNAITDWGTAWTHASYTFDGIAGNQGYHLFFGGRNGGMDIDNIMVAGSPSAVPEPESYAMMLAGFGLMGVIARRRRSR